MIKTSISRHENIYECFPDIARAADGTLVCINRESMMHAPFPFSRLAVRRSGDEGMNWSEREILIDCVARPENVAANRSWLEPDAIAGYEESRARVREPWQVGASLNCPRIVCLRDGTLLLFGDFTVAHADGRRWHRGSGAAATTGPRGRVPSG